MVNYNFSCFVNSIFGILCLLIQIVTVFSKPLNVDTNPWWYPKNDLYIHWIVRWNWLLISAASDIPKDFHAQNSGRLSRFWLSEISFGIFNAKVWQILWLFTLSTDKHKRYPLIQFALGGHLMSQLYSVCKLWTSKLWRDRLRE